VCPRASGEQSLARQLYPHLREDWLLIADRNFYNWQDWCTAADTGAALLWRVKSDLTLPPLEFYPDGLLPVVLVNPKVRGKARAALGEAARAGGNLDPRNARYVRVIEYEVPDREGDGTDEVIALITTITDFPDALRPSSRRPITKDGSTRPGTPSSRPTSRPGKDPALRIAGHGEAGDLGLPAHPLRDQRPDLHRRHENAGHRPGPGQVQKDGPHHPPPGR